MYEPRVHQHYIAGLACYLLEKCHALSINTLVATRGWDAHVAAFDASKHLLYAPRIEFLVDETALVGLSA